MSRVENWVANTSYKTAILAIKNNFHRLHTLENQTGLLTRDARECLDSFDSSPITLPNLRTVSLMADTNDIPTTLCEIITPNLRPSPPIANLFSIDSLSQVSVHSIHSGSHTTIICTTNCSRLYVHVHFYRNSRYWPSPAMSSPLEWK